MKQDLNAAKPQMPDLKSRAGLARAITLVESRRSDHQLLAGKLLKLHMPETGKARRIGITGVPGVGKSTFIDAFGMQLIKKGHKVAVLAVDPTSKRSGGSILGDKTRMANLSMADQAFIRPSPAGETLGGVARKTRETLLLCEAAGYDVVLVETVGVGQSETLVADMVDSFAVLMLPNAGDDLQGIKKGVLEVADLIAINKSDIDEKSAKAAQRHYQNALHIMEPVNPDWPVPVMTCSGALGDNLDEFWRLLEKHHNIGKTTGFLKHKRANQQVKWFQELLKEGLIDRLTRHEDAKKQMSYMVEKVRKGTMPASVAAAEIIDLFLK